MQIKDLAPLIFRDDIKQTLHDYTRGELPLYGLGIPLLCDVLTDTFNCIDEGESILLSVIVGNKVHLARILKTYPFIGMFILPNKYNWNLETFKKEQIYI